MKCKHGTKKSNRADITEVARESLANHRLVPEQTEGPVRMWYCGEPGTGIYSFRVIAAPFMILVYGDIGDYMLQASERDLIPWLRGAVKSEHYLISKFVHKQEVYLPEEADLLLKGLAREYADDDYSGGLQKIGQIRSNWNKDYDGFDKFAEEFVCAGFESELLKSVTDFESDIYWTVECLKKFVDLYATQEEPSICSCLAALVEK